MSSSSSNRRRGDHSSPPRGGVGSSKLRMDRQPQTARITDPSLPIGKRKEIDNVMKKARGGASSEYWDKKLLEAEEKEPNRWRHTGYKKMYIEGESSSDSERESNAFRYGGRNNNNARNSRSRSPRNRKSPPGSPPPSLAGHSSSSLRRRSPMHASATSGASGSAANDHRGGGGRRSPISPPSGNSRRRSPPGGDIRRRRPRSPPEPMPMRRKSPRSPRSPPLDIRGRRTPPSPILSRRRSPPVQPSSSHSSHKPRPSILPRSKRPPSPPPKGARTPSNSSLSSCSDDSCSVCSPKAKPSRSRSESNSHPTSRSRHGPRSPPPKPSSSSSGHPRISHSSSSAAAAHPPLTTVHGKPLRLRTNRPVSPHQSSHPSRDADEKPTTGHNKHRMDEKSLYHSDKSMVHRSGADHRGVGSRHAAAEELLHSDGNAAAAAAPKHGSGRVMSARSRLDMPEDPRLKLRPPEPPEPATSVLKKSKDKSLEKLRAKVKIEGEKRSKKNDTSDSEESDSSENSLPTFTATTRLTLSDRFGKMAQWSVDRSNMENMNMRITKDSSDGALKVMIEEGLVEEPPRRYSYSPAPAGHFPEELATTAPTGLMSWDDVRVRYEYYKSRGYLRDLDLKDYVKWEEWWYRYQEWLKQERYYEFYERQQMHRRRRKKIPIAQRLN